MSRVIISSVNENGTRISFWLAVHLVLIRLLVIKSNSEDLSKPIIGWILFVITVTISLIISLNVTLREQIIEIGNNWIPPTQCLQYFEGYSEKEYYSNWSSRDDGYWYVRARSWFIAISQTTISIVHPILALILCIEVRISAFKISDINQTGARKRLDASRMIMYLSLSFVISSAPWSLVWLVQVFITVHSKTLLELLTAYGTIISSIFFCMNATAQCLICFFSSSVYRQVAKSVLCIDRCEPETSSEVTPTIGVNLHVGGA